MAPPQGWLLPSPLRAQGPEGAGTHHPSLSHLIRRPPAASPPRTPARQGREEILSTHTPHSRPDSCFPSASLLGSADHPRRAHPPRTVPAERGVSLPGRWRHLQALRSVAASAPQIQEEHAERIPYSLRAWGVLHHWTTALHCFPLSPYLEGAVAAFPRMFCRTHTLVKKLGKRPLEILHAHLALMSALTLQFPQ